MLTVELKINGSLIEYISITNKGHMVPGQCDVEYEVKHVKLDTMEIAILGVRHDPDDGALVLVAKAIEEVGKC